MTRVALACLLLLSACASSASSSRAPTATPPAATPAGTAAPAGDPALHALFEAYFEASLELDPLLASSIGDRRYDDRLAISIDPAVRAREERLERDFLARTSQFDPARLSAADRLSLEIFRSGRARAIAGYAFPDHLLPVDQFSSLVIRFAQLGSGRSIHPFQTARDYDNFLSRIGHFVRWIDQAIANMKEGVKKGYTIPRVLAEKVLPQLAAHLVARAEDSIFWGPIAALPGGISAADRARLTDAYRQAILTQLVPAYRRLHDFVRDEYLPKCRTTVGLEALPDGRAWYAYRVREMTTTTLSPTEIHELGLREVARIQAQMEAVQRRIGFAGTRAQLLAHLNSDPTFFYTDRDALISGYAALKQQVNERLPALFEVFPAADYEVRAVEPFRERSAAGGQYQAASEDGSRPGVFYANAYDLKARPKWSMVSLSLHEANPGHHFQISVAREQRGLPRFRRFGRYSAYSEGWGLYAETLGHELGLYADPYQAYGQLEAELWRAVRLVVDTGLHDRGWTRARVLDYMLHESGAAETRRVAEAERYMAMPGQALAYKVGQLKIRELRERAEKALGPRFDVKKFHSAILLDGPMPLDVLEAKIERWIVSAAR